MHPPRHLLLKLGDEFSSNGLMFKAAIYQFLWFSSHGLMFKAAIYQFLGFSSHGSNSQEIFLSHQLILVALHGSNFHLVVVYVPDLVEYILLLPKRNIPPDIII